MWSRFAELVCVKWWDEGIGLGDGYRCRVGKNSIEKPTQNPPKLANSPK